MSGGFVGAGVGPTANKGTINISSSGIYEFHGTLLNENGATINNRGEIRPYTGTLQNEGTIYNYLCGGKVGWIDLDNGIFTGNAPIASDFCFVVPESPIGSIAMVTASLSALGTFVYFRQYRGKANI